MAPNGPSPKPRLKLQMKIKTLRPEIIEQLLFAKWLLSQLQDTPETRPNSFSIAKKILIAHDAAEVGIAAIADQIEALPKNKASRFLMDYFEPIKTKVNKEIEGREFCRKLNQVRIDIKHGMILPDPNQWVNVIDKVYNCLSIWCQDLLNISLNGLDNSILIQNKEIKKLYDEAKKEETNGNYQQVLELLGKALYILFEENNALRAMPVGTSKAEDAIKLAAFGVHANDYLVLQDFLPKVTQESDGDFSIRWTQENFGHPGNWREESVSFCMRVFLDLALKIQNASWIPGPIPFFALYQYRIEAIKDNVEIWNNDGQRNTAQGWKSIYDWPTESSNKNVVKTLKKGEAILGMITRDKKTSLDLFNLNKSKNEEPEEIFIYSKEVKGYVKLEDVKIKCVPSTNEEVKKYFPDLPIVDMQLD